MSVFQDPDIVAIQRFKADVFILTKERIKFTLEGSKVLNPFSAILDPRFYRGNIDILEDAVRNKRKLWLIIEVRKVSTTNSVSQGFSASGKIFVLSDAHYVNEAEELEDINPSKR
jgi:hypothetical protein